MTGLHSGFTSLLQLTFCDKYHVLMFICKKEHDNGDNHIQNFHLGRYIVVHTSENYVLRLRSPDRTSDDIPPKIIYLKTVIP